MKEKVRQLFKQTRAGAVFIKAAQPRDYFFNYFTGLPKHVYESNFLLLKPGQTIVYSSFLDFQAVKNFLPKNISVREFKSKKHLIQLLKKDLRQCRKIGLNYEAICKARFARLKKIFPGKKVFDVSQQLNQLRETKTAREIKLIKQSCRLAAEIMEKTESKIKPGKTENEIQKEINLALAQLEVKPAFEPIVASGKNISVPHHITSRKKLKKGELLLIDFGVDFQNYCSDLSRTFVLGKATERQKEIYGTVFLALQESLKEIRAGNQAKKSFKAVQKVFQPKKFSMAHGLGHGLGLEDHDLPHGFNEKTKWRFKENMVLAVEPAVYLSREGGCRIEDNVVVKKGKPLMLSKAPKELIPL